MIFMAVFYIQVPNYFSCLAEVWKLFSWSFRNDYETSPDFSSAWSWVDNDWEVKYIIFTISFWLLHNGSGRQERCKNRWKNKNQMSKPEAAEVRIKSQLQ